MLVVLKEGLSSVLSKVFTDVLKKFNSPPQSWTFSSTGHGYVYISVKGSRVCKPCNVLAVRTYVRGRYNIEEEPELKIAATGDLTLRIRYTLIVWFP